MREILDLLNAPTREERIENLKKLLEAETEKPKLLEQYSNNHIHTSYSFSPYSPTAAIWFARQAGLGTAGIMDHDSIAGAGEFREAGRLAGVSATCGFEARLSLKGTPFENRKMNNPDQTGVAYMAFHSVRREHFDHVQNVFAPLREKRNERNRLMTANAARETGIDLDFDTEVLPLSQFGGGGSVTERHILFALAKKMEPDASFDESYRLLGKLKSELVPKIYVPAGAELMTLEQGIGLAKDIDAILCYAYLGDVVNSVTGDKKPAKYEDNFLDEFIGFLYESGIRAVTFMPSRNTAGQLERIMALCVRYGMRQISGEDINSPGQDFICRQLADPRYLHLVKAARELIDRED